MLYIVGFSEKLISHTKRESTIFTVYIRTDRPEQTDEILQNAVSRHSLHCLPMTHQFSDTTSGSKLYLFKF